MMKTTIILNDFATNVKAYISYDGDDVEKMIQQWGEEDERLSRLHILEPFRGYTRWSELTPEHYRLLVTRGLNTLAKLSPEQRQDVSLEAVSTTNFLILAFIIALEKKTSSEIEHFRINRFDELNVSFDYSASFDLEYKKPRPKGGASEPAFSIVVDNLSDDQ